MSRGREKPSPGAALIEMLRGGDRRSVGRVAEVVAAVRRDPRLFPALFEGMFTEDEVVRMRAADAAEKVTVDRPELLQPLKRRLLDDVARSEQQEVRWHVAQMLPRLRLTTRERAQALALLFSYLGDKSRIVKTFSMQALADLATDDEKLRSRVVAAIGRLTAAGSPAVKSRGRRLLGTLRGTEGGTIIEEDVVMAHAGRNTTLAGRPTGSVDFASTFKRLKRAVKRHAGFLAAQTDTGTEYILTGPVVERWKKELWFGGVKQGKSYVSLHLMAVYMFPDLLDGISPELRARMQGKSCFNFKRIEPPLLDEVDALIRTCVERLRTERILPPGRNSPTRPAQPMDQVVESALKKRKLMAAYRARPAYQQNDYLGWINRAKRPETMAKRLEQMLDELAAGDRYMKMKWKARLRREGPRAK